MFEQLISWDNTVFYLVNTAWANALCDAVMPWLRNKFFWAPVYVFLVAFFLVNFKQRGIYALLYLGVVVIFCDQISSDIIKPMIGRVRPCNDPFWNEHIRLLVHCGSGLSFTSSHAANHFGVAAFLGMILWHSSRIVLPVAFAWAAAVCYAQVYVGVHYPLDVAGGALLGITIGGLLSLLYRKHFKTLAV